MPTDNVMAGLRIAGAAFGTGKGKKTFKAQTQSGCVPETVYWSLAIKGAAVPVAPFFDGMERRSYDERRVLLWLRNAEIEAAACRRQPTTLE